MCEAVYYKVCIRVYAWCSVGVESGAYIYFYSIGVEGRGVGVDKNQVGVSMVS